MRKNALNLCCVLTGVLVFLSGCITSQPTATPGPATVITTPAIPAQTTAPAPNVTPPVQTAATAVVPDPILHRWVRTETDHTGQKIAYEYTFHTDGTMIYRYGLAKEISGNIFIDRETQEASGTWIKVGEDRYDVEIRSPVAGASPLVRKYTLRGHIPGYAFILSEYDHYVQALID